MNDLARWTTHTPMSDPGGCLDEIACLPSEAGRLNAIVQGLLIHSSWFGEYGLDETRLGPVSRTTLPVAERLETILQRDGRPLDQARTPEKRSVGTCRDFALLLCAFLRGRGIPARVRCGFASYFATEWEDHWVCEYWDEGAGSWRLSDAQIDDMLRRKSGIEFDAADMPREVFILAGDAWLKCRRGEADPESFGHGSATGLWFLKVNVFRDHHVLNGRETSEWDRWREASPADRLVADDDLPWLDDLALRPGQPLVSRKPDWLR